MLQKLILDLFLILENNPKQPLHARNSFINQIFWKRIIKKLYKRQLYFSFEPHVIRITLASHSYVARMYSYVIRMSLVCTRMSSICHWYVLVFHPYVTGMYSYVIRMSLIYPHVCTCMSSVCHSCVVLPWTTEFQCNSKTFINCL